MLDYNDCTISAGLQDVGYKGTKFTWVKKEHGLSKKIVGLDKVFNNAYWITTFKPIEI